MKQIQGIYFSVLMCLAIACTPEPVKTETLTWQDVMQENVQQPADVPTSGVHVINIRGMLFEPAELTVRKGDTVIWKNNDILAHDVTEVNTEKRKSPRLEAGSQWSLIINEPLEYFCSIHVVMKGRIALSAD